MNVFISTDMEGLAGIVGWHQTSEEGRDYAIGRQWMTEEVNAAVKGAVRGGATSVVVKDAHNSGTNILLDKLNPAAELIAGWGPLGGMVEGVDESFDVVMLLGYHARALTISGTLAHTWSGNLLELTLNGQLIGEAAWAAAFAGHFGVPIAMITGDDQLKSQVEQELPPGFHFVITKSGMGQKAARLRPLTDVWDEIAETAAAALADIEGLPVFRPDWPATVTMRFRHWEGLDICAAVPQVKRVDACTFQFEAANAIEAQKCFATLHRLAPRP